MRYLVPLESDLGSHSRISSHFGRSPYYALVSRDPLSGGLRVEIKSALGGAGGGACSAGDLVRRLEVDAVIVKGIGVRAIQVLRELGVKIYKTGSETLDQVMKEIEEGRLTPFTSDEACRGMHPRS